MQGSIAIRNVTAALIDEPTLEFLYTLQADDTIERVTTDTTLFFQKAFLYPVASFTNGVPNNNANPVNVGKSGAAISFTPTSLISAAGVAVVTYANHGLRNGMSIQISGATPAAYNGLRVVRNATPNTFEFQPATDPAGPASVLPTIARAQFLPDLLNPTDLPIVYELPLGRKMRIADLIVRGKANDGVFIQAW